MPSAAGAVARAMNNESTVAVRKPDATAHGPTSVAAAAAAADVRGPAGATRKVPSGLQPRRLAASKEESVPGRSSGRGVRPEPSSRVMSSEKSSSREVAASPQEPGDPGSGGVHKRGRGADGGSKEECHRAGERSRVQHDRQPGRRAEDDSQTVAKRQRTTEHDGTASAERHERQPGGSLDQAAAHSTPDVSDGRAEGGRPGVPSAPPGAVTTAAAPGKGAARGTAGVAGGGGSGAGTTAPQAPPPPPPPGAVTLLGGGLRGVARVRLPQIPGAVDTAAGEPAARGPAPVRVGGGGSGGTGGGGGPEQLQQRGAPHNQPPLRPGTSHRSEACSREVPPDRNGRPDHSRGQDALHQGQPHGAHASRPPLPSSMRAERQGGADQRQHDLQHGDRQRQRYEAGDAGDGGRSRQTLHDPARPAAGQQHQQRERHPGRYEPHYHHQDRRHVTDQRQEPRQPGAAQLNGHPAQRQHRDVQAEHSGRPYAGVQGTGSDRHRGVADDRKRGREEHWAAAGGHPPLHGQTLEQPAQRRRSGQPARKRDDCYDFPGL
jgi:hypothetical protein